MTICVLTHFLTRYSLESCLSSTDGSSINGSSGGLSSPDDLSVSRTGTDSKRPGKGRMSRPRLPADWTRSSSQLSVAQPALDLEAEAGRPTAIPCALHPSISFESSVASSREGDHISPLQLPPSSAYPSSGVYDLAPSSTVTRRGFSYNASFTHLPAGHHSSDAINHVRNAPGTALEETPFGCCEVPPRPSDALHPWQQCGAGLARPV